MIINLGNFINSEQPYWDELAGLLNKVEGDNFASLSLEEAKRLHYLYERTASDLIRVSTFASAPEITGYLEGLVARAYGEIHEVRERRTHNVRRFVLKTFPRTFRKHWRPFALSCLATVVGVVVGILTLAFAPDTKGELLPEMAQENPTERVARENQLAGRHLEGIKATFAGELITHNIQVGFMVLAMGMTWGIGSAVELFYNGFILGAVCYDYVHANETLFLIGWLLPHGSIEIPSILIAGQAAFILAAALIGSRSKRSLGARLHDCRDDVMTLALGFAMLLVWAGITEAFFSQYHEPVLPYSVKIAFGCAQLTALCCYLWLSGTGKEDIKA